MIERKFIPLFYFRPTLCFIDDDSYFLEALTFNFSDQFKCLTFTSSKLAAEFVLNYKSPLDNNSFVNNSLDHDGYYNIEQAASSLSVSRITELTKDKNRFNEIAILIVDQQMPELSGLEICELLKNKNLKIILLTGESDHSKVIRAFNEGLIDLFISKNDPDLGDILIKHIESLIYDFFCNKTLSYMSYLETDYKKSISDSKFVDFFTEYCNNNKICEYYIIDKYGSLLMIDLDGNTSYLILMSQREINSFIEFNIDSADHTTRKLLEQMERHEVIPFFGVGKEYWQVDMKLWRPYFYPAQQLLGRELYLYTIIKRPTLVLLSGGNAPSLL